MLRRIEKRMAINNITDVSLYADFVAKNNKEKRQLKDDFLIGVTHFFRDSEAFDILKVEVIPKLCGQKKKGETIRIWIPGCSSGEEVFSIAMLLDDYITKQKLELDFKIFATDIDQRGVDTAGLGIFPKNVVNEIDSKYVEKYFVSTGERLKITKAIREHIVFSRHNLISDPPFINMDLVSCRNLLIYLDSRVQRRVLQNFQFSLNTLGFLFLGNSESLGSVASHFKTIDSKWKIFQNITESKFIPKHTKPLAQMKVESKKKLTSGIIGSNKHDQLLQDYPFNKYLSKRHSPDAIFIDNEFNILFIKGNVGQKLYHGEGVFQNNLLKIVNEEIAILLKNGIRRLNNVKHDVLIKDITNKTEYGEYTYDIKLHRLEPNNFLNECYLIEFTEEVQKNKNEETIIAGDVGSDGDKIKLIEDLENELDILKSELQNAVEQLETTNEELQSSNEELMAANEELQSTNEELQSVNEELYTVNSELQDKNKELTHLTNDLINLLDNTQIATLFLDTELRIRKFTPAIKSIFNLEDNDIGRKLSTFTSNFPPATSKKLIADAKNVLEKLSTVENQVIDLDGNYYMQRVSPFITTDKTIDGVVITINNINSIIEIQNKLEEADSNYSNLFNSLNEGFIHAKILLDKHGNPIDWEYLDVNNAYVEILGKTRDEIIGKRVSDILPNLVNDPKQWIQKYGETALKGKKQTIRGYVQSINKYFEVNTFSPKKGEFACTIFDLTELKQGEEDLRRYARELNSIQRITHVGSWTLNLSNGEVTWSEELYRIFKLDKNLPAPNYEDQSKLFTPDSWETLAQAVSLAHTEGRPYELELRMIKADGEQGWLLGKGEAVKENGKIVGLRGAAQDITKAKENELALISAKKKAEEAALANLQKNYFLANMSHEIRTPISSVLGFADLLRNDSLDKAERLRYLEIIDSNSKQLLNLINDIIDISKIESGKLELHYGACDVDKLLDNLTLTFEQIKLQKDKPDLKLKPVIPKKLKGLNLHTDIRRLEQVLINLINNAIKFSKSGTITYGYKEDGDFIKFYVKDEGMGIPKAKQQEIFDSFRQLNYKNKENYGGTGLGLAICKALVSMLGGEITVESKRYEGSIFEFTVPYKTVKSNTSKKPPLSATKDEFLKDKSILIAEDNKLIRLLLDTILKRTGAKLTFTENGREAVRQFKSDENIDLVLLDIRMPKMSGIEALDLMLKMRPNAKIIMQTAHAMEEEKELCFEKGCIDFISKPILKEELYQKLSKWLN